MLLESEIENGLPYNTYIDYITFIIIVIVLVIYMECAYHIVKNFGGKKVWQRRSKDCRKLGRKTLAN